MRKYIFVVAMMIGALTQTLTAQTYGALWKQVEQDLQKDLPQTAMKHLQTIAAKAAKERAYGHLLKATLQHAQLQAEVTTDSLRSAVERLERQDRQTVDVALKAVYDVVLAKIYTNNTQLADDWQIRQQRYERQAKEHPDVLARVATDRYVPMVVKGKDSAVFGHDLLSVVGAELGDWQWLSRYYARKGNRRAACLAAAEGVTTLRQADSLIALYGDLPEAGELAVRRYDLMGNAPVGEQADWLQKALDRWGSWRRANSLRNSWKALTQPTFSAQIDHSVMEVGKAQTVRLTSVRHLEQLTMRVYRTTLSGDTELSPDRTQDLQQIRRGMKELPALQRTLTWKGHADYDVYADSLQLGALPAGVYLIEFSSKPLTTTVRQLYYVSGVRWMSQPMPNNRLRFVVVDATTGQPLGGAQIRLRNYGNNGKAQWRTMTCNSEGELLYRRDGYSHPEVFVSTSADHYLPPSATYTQYNYYERRYDNEHTQLFTDRRIYRPGQTVSVTAIVWKELSATEQTAVAGKSVRIELRDANYKLVGEQQLVTDRYGKCTTRLTLPTGQLNGRYTIRSQGSSTTIRVEEYKRPTFTVAFDDYRNVYQAGDTVRAEGKAATYAGVPVQGAQVHYKVYRRVAFWWLNYWQYGRGDGRPAMQGEMVGEGSTVTADDGTFAVEMPMVMPAGDRRRPMFYHFVAEADVTDVAGETHSGMLTLPLGNRPTALTCDLPQQVRGDQLPLLTFGRHNAAGKEIDGRVSYRIDGGKWHHCAANAQHQVFGNQLTTGSHRLEAVCEQDTIDRHFVVFGLDDRRPATITDDWFYLSANRFPADGQPVTLQVGSSDPDLHIVYACYAANRLIESGTVKKSGELVNRKLTYREEYGNGLLVSYAWVKNGVCHTHQATIERPMPDKQLRLTWETFRDRLVPEQQEEWRLRIRRADGKAADATLMAVLYDKSLDALTPHQWSFRPVSALSQPATGWLWHSWGGISCNGAGRQDYLTVPTMDYSRLDDSVYPYYRMPVYHVRGSRPLMLAKQAAPMAMEAVDEMKVVSTAANSADGMTADRKQASVESSERTATDGTADVQLRENLNETAFCYPALTTDGDGSVTMRFTLPESLTTWRFMGVAHTTDMSYGSIDGEAVARKDVMIQPNMPRFVRTGDKVTLSARIFNTGDKDVSGTAALQLVDPETERVVVEQVVPFRAEAGQTATVDYLLEPDGSMPSLLVCRMTARGDGFSDGEQHYLPVLSDREWVTKTVAYTQHGAGVKTVDLTRLFPQGATQPQLTVTYTQQPAWLVVQSMATLGQPREHSAIDQAASYYSNLMAKVLLDRNPQVKGVFEQWKREDAAQATLHSSLEKDEELKDLVLAETPWVADANRESEQKQRLADFFDDNLIGNRLNSAVEQLKKLQRPDGSFAWYPGMEGSVYITVAVEEMLVRLNSRVGEQQDIRQLQARAFGYLGGEMADLVARMKQEEKQGHRQTFPSFTALRWLYLCALDGRTLPADVRSANDYLIGLLKKDIRRQTIYEKALTAIVLAHHGERAKAAEYVQSLKEYSVCTEEMGRYYDTPRAAYSWYDYKIPTEVAALEAIRLLAPADSTTVDEMRRWLLQEKRTQVWDTPINSINAIHAFLSDDTALAPQGGATVLAVDGHPIDLPKATAAVGYVKATAPQGKTFTATKTSRGTSWGALYARCFQKGSEVEAAGSGISVRRELLADGPLAVGQRVRVRLTIESSRDLDFVQVVDRRAACMEPVGQLSGYQNGAYVSPKDYATHYFYRRLSKGRHVIETTYYIDRAGRYETGTCTAGCAYAPEYRATAPSQTLEIQQP